MLEEGWRVPPPHDDDDDGVDAHRGFQGVRNAAAVDDDGGRLRYDDVYDEPPPPPYLEPGMSVGSLLEEAFYGRAKKESIIAGVLREFEAEEVDLDAFLLLEERHLCAMSISMGNRLRIMGVIGKHGRRLP